MKEVFKQVPNTNYWVSNLGRVYNSYSKKYSYGTLCNNGYMVFGGHFTVHRCVAQLFIPNPNNLATVNHKNEIKTDNRVENLEWMSLKDNLNYGTHNQRANDSKRGKHYPKQSEAAKLRIKKHGNFFTGKGMHWYYDKELNKRVYYN